MEKKVLFKKLVNLGSFGNLEISLFDDGTNFGLELSLPAANFQRTFPMPQNNCSIEFPVSGVKVRVAIEPRQSTLGGSSVRLRFYANIGTWVPVGGGIVIAFGTLDSQKIAIVDDSDSKANFAFEVKNDTDADLVGFDNFDDFPLIEN